MTEPLVPPPAALDSFNPEQLLVRGGEVIAVLLTGGVAPFTDPADLLCLELLGILVLRALGVEGGELTTQISRLTSLAELINVQPLRQLIAEHRAARGQSGPEGASRV